MFVCVRANAELRSLGENFAPGIWFSTNNLHARRGHSDTINNRLCWDVFTGQLSFSLSLPLLNLLFKATVPWDPAGWQFAF